jgi:hypothetical protein
MQEQPAPDTPWLTERLTEAEIEALRKDQDEALTYAQKAFFPNARIHRVGDDSTEAPKP